MMKVAVITLALCLFPTLALAEVPGAQCAQSEDCTEYFMDSEAVTGELQRPDGDIIGGQHIMHRPPLIRTRSHFVNEMVKSVEDI